MSVLGIFSHSNQMRMDRGQLSDPRWTFDHFSLFFGNYRPNLANFTPQMTMNTLKLVYHHALVSVLGICSHSNRLGMNKDRLSHPLSFVNRFFGLLASPGDHIQFFGDANLQKCVKFNFFFGFCLILLISC